MRLIDRERWRSSVTGYVQLSFFCRCHRLLARLFGGQ